MTNLVKTTTSPPLTRDIPAHLKAYIVQQDPTLYTPIDHACWRFVLKVSRAFFAENAHKKYLDGLSETGISVERIPLISEMDARLSQFGWRAVAVSGFIPPAAFMEFFSLGILPIACDMRSLDHLSYTPAPDIVHEAAGHAPIIADREYADYLRAYGSVSKKAIYSNQDMAVYHAIRELSEVKEAPGSTPLAIENAQRRLDIAIAGVSYISEATHLARMNWWTVEYGLVGSMEQPKIYGAGLLSSLGESFHCLDPKVKKIPFSIECIHMTYDITRPQPQLYVTQDFHKLKEVMYEYAETMAYQQGGIEGLMKAQKAETVTTAVLDSGLQISGKLVSVRTDSTGIPAYLSYQGPVQLAYSDHQIDKQGPEQHPEGFGSPTGVLKNTGQPASGLSDQEIKSLTHLEFSSGVTVEGKITGSIRKNDKLVIVSWSDCTVRLGGDVLFQPSWGTYDMACGAQITSVYGGPADFENYSKAIGGGEPTSALPKTNLTAANRELNDLYAKVRKVREKNLGEAEMLRALTDVHTSLEARYPHDWLLRIELLELNATFNLKAPWEKSAHSRLLQISSKGQDKSEMIGRALKLL